MLRIVLCVLWPMLFAGCASTAIQAMENPPREDQPIPDAINIANETVAPPPPPRLANGTVFKYAAENWTYEWKVNGQYERNNQTEYSMSGWWQQGSRLWRESWRLDVNTLNINLHSSADGTLTTSCPPREGGILPLQNRTYACPVEIMYQYKWNPLFELEIHGYSQISVEGSTYGTTNFTLWATTDGERHVFMEAAYSDDIGFFTWFDFSWHDQPSMTLVGIETP